MLIFRVLGVISFSSLLFLLSGCLRLGTPALGIEITGISIARQLCDLNLNSSYELAVTWRAYGGTPPLTVWISYETLEGRTQAFGPFPWPEQNSFTLFIDSYEGESLLVQASAQDKEGSRTESARHITLRPCASLPPMKPMITIVPSGGTATQEHMTIEATMTNTLGIPTWAEALVAIGCTVERTQPELPLLLEPQASVKVQVNLRCPEGGARWKLRVVERLPQPSIKAVLSHAGETYDDLLLRVAQQVPAFGGMFFEFAGRQYTGVLYIYLVDPSQKEKEWFDRMSILHHLPEVTMSDIDDAKNRLTIGLEKMDAEAVSLVEHELARLGIPREAVILEETGPFLEEKLDVTHLCLASE